MKSAPITIALAIVTLLTALRAASLWRSASQKMPRTKAHMAGSQDHVLQIEREVAEASFLNSQAALWSGGTAVMSALTTLWSALASLI
jgi:hypothetical protein